jgi:hypothetical protein
MKNEWQLDGAAIMAFAGEIRRLNECRQGGAVRNNFGVDIARRLFDVWDALFLLCYAVANSTQ